MKAPYEYWARSCVPRWFKFNITCDIDVMTPKPGIVVICFGKLPLIVAWLTKRKMRKTYRRNVPLTDLVKVAVEI